MPAIVEDQCSPILVRAFPGILVLVQGVRQTEPGPIIPWEMGGHPVHDNTNPGLVQGIDQELEILRRAVTTAGA